MQMAESIGSKTGLQDGEHVIPNDKEKQKNDNNIPTRESLHLPNGKGKRILKVLICQKIWKALDQTSSC